MLDRMTCNSPMVAGAYWSSYYDISAEASALKILPPEKVETFNRLIGSYNANLVLNA
jgi:hypothetical protein